MYEPPPRQNAFDRHAGFCFPKQAVDSNFSIEVTTRSTYVISTVTATVQGRTATLTYNSGTGAYTGALSLAGLTEDSTYALSVTATDGYNNTATASETILYDPPPAILLVMPYEGAVGRPRLNVKGSCTTSGGHCQIAVAISGGALITPKQVGTFTDSVIDTIIRFPTCPRPIQV